MISYTTTNTGKSATALPASSYTTDMISSVFMVLIAIGIVDAINIISATIIMADSATPTNSATTSLSYFSIIYLNAIAAETITLTKKSY